MQSLLLGQSGLIGGAIAETIACESPPRTGMDLNDPASFRPELFAGKAALIHAAGITDEELAHDPVQAWRRGTQHTAALVEAALRGGIRRFVYISTAHVYGPLEGDITEARPVNPLGDYALLHYDAEQIFRRAMLKSGADLLILRPCAVYGLPPDIGRFKRWSLIPFSFPRELLDTGAITLKSSGEQKRNFVSARGIAAEAAGFLAEPFQAGRCRVQNPLGPDDLSVYDFAQLCVQWLRPGQGRVVRPEPAAGAGPGPAPLRYRSAFPARESRSTLADTIRALAEALRA